MMEKNIQAYSYHTFYFPFVWDNAGETDYDDYIKAIEAGSWKNISVKELSDISADSVADYAAIQYFTDGAKKSVFGWKGDYMRCYQYDCSDCAKYHIKKGESVWELDLMRIQLKVYNTGIGILCFETANHHAKSLTDVKAINEYGRRIYAPYFSFDGCARCADQLGIRCGESFTVAEVSTRIPTSQKDCIPNFILELLPADSAIQPAIDDRMYVACLVNDANAFQDLMAFETNPKASESLYELIFVDREGYSTCPTENIRVDMIQKSLYRRWMGQKAANDTMIGTLYAVTHHSFLCFTASADPTLPGKSFLTIYNPMAALVLAQRATIISLDTMVSELSCDFEKKNVRLTRKKIRMLQNLQEKYIGFLNQHMKVEVTCQEQGIDLYEMLQREMNILREKAAINNEIEQLSNAANTATDNYLSLLATGLATALVFLQPVMEQLFHWFPWYYMGVIGIGILLIILFRRKK